MKQQQQILSILLGRFNRLLSFPALTLLIGFVLIVVSMVSCFYKKDSIEYSVFPTSDLSDTNKQCLGGCKTTACTGDAASAECLVVQTFGVLTALFAASAILSMVLPGLASNVPIINMSASMSSFSFASFFCGLVYLFVILFVGDSKMGSHVDSPGLGPATNDKTNLAEKIASGNSGIQLGLGFHAAWASLLMFLASFLMSVCMCADISDVNFPLMMI